MGGMGGLVLALHLRLRHDPAAEILRVVNITRAQITIPELIAAWLYLRDFEAGPPDEDPALWPVELYDIAQWEVSTWGPSSHAAREMVETELANRGADAGARVYSPVVPAGGRPRHHALYGLYRCSPSNRRQRLRAALMVNPN